MPLILQQGHCNIQNGMHMGIRPGFRDVRRQRGGRASSRSSGLAMAWRSLLALQYTCVRISAYAMPL